MNSDWNRERARQEDVPVEQGFLHPEDSQGSIRKDCYTRSAIRLCRSLRFRGLSINEFNARHHTLLSTIASLL